MLSHIFLTQTWNVWIRKFYFMLGYVMYERRGKKLEISKIVNVVLWIFFLSLFLFVNIAFYPFAQKNYESISLIAHGLYGCFCRVGWSLSVAWIIFACQNESGGIIRWFLSLKLWQPLSRMGLSIYLTHRMYQIITTYNQKQPIYWDFFTQLQKFYGDVSVAIFLGAFLWLAVETPVMLIENYLHQTLMEPKANGNKIKLAT